jgi:hypothetical protein
MKSTRHTFGELDWRGPSQSGIRNCRKSLVAGLLLFVLLPLSAPSVGADPAQLDQGSVLADETAAEDSPNTIEDLGRRLKRLEERNIEWFGDESHPPGSELPERLAPDDARSSPFYTRFLFGGYDDEQGNFILVQPRDAQRVPFELRLDIFTQARLSNFSRSSRSSTDSTGMLIPTRDFESVEMTRNFLQFSGYGLDPRLQYTVIIFSSTAINDTVYLGWINYHFSDAVDVRVGNWLVPGTREWYTSFRYTVGADRLMATTFFRPNISPGVWLQGDLVNGVHYVAMFANSLNRFTQGVNRVGPSDAFGGTVWWEPTADYGLGPSDIEDHHSPSVRVGTSTALSVEQNQGVTDPGVANPEDTILRLSDGTPLFRPGALGPGVNLTSASIQLWSLDAGFKYRGFGLSGEYFLRWLDHFESAGAPSPFSSLFDHGGLLQGSYFLFPTKFEAFARSTFVTGHFGSGNEFGGGANWYPQGQRTWRVTGEVIHMNHCPAENLLTGYRAGQSGTLFQLQVIVDF